MTRKASHNKKKILIVEDEPIIGILCRRALNAEGFSVDVVDNGLKAKEIANSKNYDLCVSDIKLPGITGIQLYQYWEKDNRPLAYKTIFITGDVLNNTVQDFLEKSKRPCILKPFTPQELIATVHEVLKSMS